MLHANIIKAATPEEAGKLAADVFEALIRTKPACLLGLATGSTPLPLYRELIAREKAGKIDFSRVRSANLDEYKGLGSDHPQSYRYFMQDNLFNHISIKPENTIVPDGLATDPEAMFAAYENQIEAWGGVDLQLLGIGHDGHIGFNEPCDHFPKMTHEVELTAMTREANKRFFASLDEVPTAAFTMGIGTVMAARRSCSSPRARTRRRFSTSPSSAPSPPRCPRPFCSSIPTSRSSATPPPGENKIWQ